MSAGRSFTVRSAAALVAAGLAATVVAGCGSSKGPARNTAAHGKATASPSASASASASPSTTPGDPESPAPSTSATPSTSPSTGGSGAVDPNDPSLQPKGGLPPVISKLPTTDKVVFITIDDGWQKDADFVKLIKDQQIPITVFLMNDAAKGDYGYFRELQEAGALIEDHTMTHPLMTRLSYQTQKAQICQTADIYGKQYGTRPTLFRAPYGASNAATKKAAADCGMKAIFFWREVSEHGNLEYQTAGGLQPGDIILVHFKPNMTRDFKTLLGRITRQGFKPAALQNYLPAPFFQQATNQ
jgi:peptidoglycan/xylan/chitin deacetylase (PgdA/CDA1 family)